MSAIMQICVAVIALVIGVVAIGWVKAGFEVWVKVGRTSFLISLGDSYRSKEIQRGSHKQNKSGRF